VIIDGVGGATFGQAIEHLTPRGVVVNVATQSAEDTITFHARGSIGRTARWSTPSTSPTN
jgi:hypothetical protein